MVRMEEDYVASYGSRVFDCGVWSNMEDFPLFCPSFIPPQIVMVSEGDRYLILVLVLSLPSLCLFWFPGEFPLGFSLDG